METMLAGDGTEPNQLILGEEGETSENGNVNINLLVETTASLRSQGKRKCFQKYEKQNYPN